MICPPLPEAFLISWTQLVNHDETIVIFLHFDRISMPGIIIEEIVAKFFSGNEDFAEASVILLICSNSKIKKLEGAVNGGGGAVFVAFRCPFERAGNFAANIAHLVGDRVSPPILASFFTVDVV